MPRGHLVIRVKEASGKTKSESVVWDPNFIEGFLRAELRTTEGKKSNVQTTPKRVIANQITWEEELRLEVNDGSKELRLMLCREKRTGTRVGTSVIAACGIFVKDLLSVVPIDKYFELYKPGAAGDGGFIRVLITFEDHSRGGKGQPNPAPSPAASEKQPIEFHTQVSLDPEDAAIAKGSEKIRRPTPRPPAPGGDMDAGSVKEEPILKGDTASPNLETSKSPKRGSPVLKVGLLLATVGAVVFFVQKNKEDEEQKKPKTDKIRKFFQKR